MAGGKTTLANLVVNLLFDAGGAGQGIQDFGKKVAQVGQDLTSAGKSMTESFTLPIVAGMAAAGAAAATWNDALGKLAADAGVSKEEVDGLGRSIKDIANETGKGPVELVEAFGDIGSAVGDVNAQMKLLEGSAKASAAGFGETNAIIKSASTVMSGYAKDGLDVTKTMDLLVATSQQAEVPIEELGRLFGKNAADAQVLGVGIKDVAGSIAVMSQATGNSGKAASQFNAILKEFNEPSKTMKSALSDMGMSIDDVRKSIQERGLFATMQMLQSSLASTGKGFGDFFSSSSAAAGALELVGGTGVKAGEIFGAIASSAGATDQAFKASASTMREWSILTSSFFDLLSELGKSLDPLIGAALQMLNQKIQEATAWWMGLGTEWQEFILMCAGLIAALGPVVTVVGLMVTALGGLIGAVGAIVSGVTSFVGLLGGMPAILGAVAAALTALGGPAVIGLVTIGILALAQTFEEALGDIMLTVMEGAAEIGAQLVDFGVSIVDGITSGVTGAASSIAGALASIGPAITSALGGIFTGAMSAIKSALSTITGFVASWASSILDKIKAVAGGIAGLLGFGDKAANASAPGSGGRPGVPGAGPSPGFRPGSRAPDFPGAGQIAAGFRGGGSSFASSGLGSGSSAPLPGKGSSKGMSQTITINMDGREVARQVVKGMPEALAAGVGFRGSM